MVEVANDEELMKIFCNVCRAILNVQRTDGSTVTFEIDDGERYEVTISRTRSVGSSYDTCVCCGDPVPEGRQVCPRCEKENKI